MNLQRKALLLSYFTVGYNIIEGIVAIAVGSLTGSIALVGFGLDSFIESLSGSVMIWRFSKKTDGTHEGEDRLDEKATTLVAYSFFIFGAYVLYESLKKLYLRETPEPSFIGILIATSSLIVMPILFHLKRQTATALKSRSFLADSKQTLACIFMSVSLLVGLGLNYLYGLWWADPVVGIIIVMFLFKEGYAALKEKKLCGC